MAKITAFALVRNHLGERFDSAMKARLESGWEPYGPISKDPNNTSYVMQAVVRYEPDSVGEVAYVAASELVELQEKVTNRIAEGWTLYGELTIGSGNGGTLFCQTMTRSRRQEEAEPKS